MPRTTRLRVAQWTTGKVGTPALRAILDDPRLELVGVFAHSPDKTGRDAGDLCGRQATGLGATGDVEAILATKPDAVVYTPFMADLDQVERLLSAGVDIVSTNLFLNCGGIEGATRDRIEAACLAGQSSFYMTGVNPGWVNNVAAALTVVCRRVDRVAISESANVSNYASPETWDAMGMGRTSADEDVRATAMASMVSFRDAAKRVADALGLELDDLGFELEYATVTGEIDLGYMTLARGSHGALRSSWIGTIAGQEVVRVSVAWYLTDKLAEGWTFDDDHYRIAISGDPDVETAIRFVAPHWADGDWSILTALPAVSAVPAVVSARPGILGLNDIGLIAAPVGAWRNT